MLHSASSNESGVPQQLLDAKQQELRERREREAAIQVGGSTQAAAEWCILPYIAIASVLLLVCPYLSLLCVFILAGAFFSVLGSF